MTTAGRGRHAAVAYREAQHRYGAVFLIILTLLVFAVLAPDADWARAVAVALAGAALTVAVATSRERGPVRSLRALVVGGAALVVVIGIATGALSAGVAFIVTTLVAASIPFALGGGLMRLIRDEGVTLQAVAGALAIYLLVGLLFASVIGFVAHVQSGPYFSQGGNVSNGDRVYYSFTVLTTTGFGDYTAAKPLGHALAVLEMLAGQLYLVTVIGILVGSFVARRK
jgi:hypothetical protein